MQTILPSEFKRQMVVMLDGSPHIIEDMHTSGTAQTRHKLQTRLRHLTTGRVIDRVFAENERVPVAPFLTAGQYFGMYLQGTVSNTYRIEWTTDLDTSSLWTPLFNVTLQTNPQFVADPNPPQGLRFYRAIQVSP
jgi:hypothetical protein